jgi:hypothetical protein
VTQILALISQTEAWLKFHKARNSHIEAAACQIRLKALRDAVEALEVSK